jgi:flagellar motor switch protein FliN
MDSLAITAEELAQVTGMSNREPPFPPVGAPSIASPLVSAPMVGNPMVTTPMAAAAVTAHPARFAPLQPAKAVGSSSNNLDLLLGVTLRVTVELGRTKMDIREILALGPGSVVELDKQAGEPVDILVNDRLIARGEVVVIDDRFGVRITDVPSPAQRLSSLKER